MRLRKECYRRDRSEVEAGSQAAPASGSPVSAPDAAASQGSRATWPRVRHTPSPVDAETAAGSRGNQRGATHATVAAGKSSGAASKGRAAGKIQYAVCAGGTSGRVFCSLLCKMERLPTDASLSHTRGGRKEVPLQQNAIINK